MLAGLPGNSRVTRADVPVFETAQRVKAAEIIAVVKRHIAATQTVRDAGASAHFQHVAFEQAAENTKRF